MNWNEIKEKYPKAFENLFESGMYHFDGHPRDLYDFFDSQGIYIDVTCNKAYFGCDILNANGEYLSVQRQNSTTRTEAEEKSFEKAFEILENKLPIK